MSDIVGTILLLALTLTLFSSVFLFVTTFPKPTPQPSSQFQASLTYGGGKGTKIVAISISHNAGPNLQGFDTQILLFSQNASTTFTSRNPFSIAQGLAGATQWTVGQTWKLTLSSIGVTLYIPDNITVSVVSAGQLLYHVTIPGQNPAVPPQFVNEGTSPVNPSVGGAFTIFVQIQDVNPLSSVTVNVTQIPGAQGNPSLPGSPTCNAAKTQCSMTFVATSGTWQFTLPSGVTNNAGTFFAFVQATDSAGLNNSVVVPIVLGSGGGGGGGGGSLTAQLSLAPALPVKGLPTTLLATVTNAGSSSGTVTVSFFANGFQVGSSSTMSVAAGGSVQVTDATAWTPSAVGAATLTVSVSGLGATSTNVAVTVFPRILLLGHGTSTANTGLGNTTAALATALTAAGIPFDLKSIPCTTTLTKAVFSAYGVAIVDYGSNSSVTGCTNGVGPDQGAITASTGTSFWVVGAKAFPAAACTSYNASFVSLIGMPSSGTSCFVTGSAAVGSVTYTAAVASGLLGSGMPTGASITIDKTFYNISTGAYSSVAFQGATGATYLGTSTAVYGIWRATASQRVAALGTDPALLKIAEPSPNTATLWGGGVDAALAFDAVNWLSGLSNSTSSGRTMVDFAVAHGALFGTNHAKSSVFYVALRSNGPIGSALTVYLLVNGATALFNGVVVSATVTVVAGGSQVAALTWEAPSAGSYTISFAIYPSGDLFAVNNQLPLSPLSLATTFV